MLLSEADRALAELSGIGGDLRNPYLLINPFNRREAVASSAIEGTISTFYDLLFFEAGLREEYKSDLADSKPDLQEVFNQAHLSDPSGAHAGSERKEQGSRKNSKNSELGWSPGVYRT
jgi:Fic family protein